MFEMYSVIIPKTDIVHTFYVWFQGMVLYKNVTILWSKINILVKNPKYNNIISYVKSPLGNIIPKLRKFCTISN